jgi:beta-carotene hydroxylase
MFDSTVAARHPKLSELGIDLLHIGKWRAACAIASPFLAFAAFWGFASSQHWIAALFALMILSFVTYGSTSHDLVHGSLGLQRLPNHCFLAAIEAIALRSGHAYQAAHLNHHARFPHDDDIEADAARMSLPRALAEGVVFQFRIYAWALRSPHGRRPWIIGEGIAIAAMVLGSIAALPWTTIPVIYVVLMIAGSWTIPLITSYLPHNAGASDVLHQTRVFRGLLVRIVAFDHLYHLEHHLYPAVPHQNWPRLARRLDPWFDAAGIKPIRIGF